MTGRIEKTIFISYHRTNMQWVEQYTDRKTVP